MKVAFVGCAHNFDKNVAWLETKQFSTTIAVTSMPSSAIARKRGGASAGTGVAVPVPRVDAGSEIRPPVHFSVSRQKLGYSLKAEKDLLLRKQDHAIVEEPNEEHSGCCYSDLSGSKGKGPAAVDRTGSLKSFNEISASNEEIQKGFAPANSSGDGYVCESKAG